MGANVATPQGLLIINADRPVYDPTSSGSLRRVSEIQLVDRNGTQITNVGQIEVDGLMFGLNIKPAGQNITELKYAFGAPNSIPPSGNFVDAIADQRVTNFLGAVFDMPGKWEGYRIPRGVLPAGPSLYVRLTMQPFKLTHLRGAQAVPIVASLGDPDIGGNTFRNHWVLGVSVLTAGKGAPHNSVDTVSRVIVIP